jgi:hypothetical protein
MIEDLKALIIVRHHIPEWDKISVKRADDHSFWIEENGHYTVITQYDPERDGRLTLNARNDTLDMTYLAENMRMIPEARLNELFTELKKIWGFTLPRP